MRCCSEDSRYRQLFQTQFEIHWGLPLGYSVYFPMDVLGLVWLLAIAPVSAALPSSFDVVVYGATPGGVQAAVAAGREGKSVALLEPSLYIGGALTGGLGQADYGQHASSVIGGQSKEFFQRVAAYYNTPFSFPPDRQCSQHVIPWTSEPHVAEQILVDMLHEANVAILSNERIVAVSTTSDGRTRIANVTTARGRVVAGTVFVDGTYEGALLKLAGCSYTFGREANTTYNEPSAGRLPTLQEVPIGHWLHGDRPAQLPTGISPYTDATNTTLIPGVWVRKHANIQKAVKGKRPPSTSKAYSNPPPFHFPC